MQIPRNRTGVSPLGEIAFTAGYYWVVNDITYNNNNKPYAIEYATNQSDWTIIVDTRGFILCNERGQFHKWPARKGNSKGIVRYFKTAIDAGDYAFGLDKGLING
jgi:hypothetical protein